MLPLIHLSLITSLNTPHITKIATQAPTNAADLPAVLPADTPLVMLASTKASDWQKLMRFKLFQNTFATAAFLLPTDWRSQYQEISQLGIGDKIAFAVMPQVASKPLNFDSSFLMLATVRETDKLKSLIERSQISQQQKVIQQQYKGIKIWQWQSSPLPQTPLLSSLKGETTAHHNCQKIAAICKQGFAIAILPKGYVAIAPNPRAIEQLINTPKTNRLAQNLNFQKTSSNPLYNRALFTVYQDPAKYIKYIESFLKEFNYPLNPLTASQMEQVKTYSFANSYMWIESEGIHLQANSYWQTPRKNITNITSADREKFLARIPAPAYSTVLGENLIQYWQAIALIFSSSPQLKAQFNQFQNSFRSATKLDIERDVLKWMDGKYALFFYPSQRGAINSSYKKLNLGVGFLVQTSDRAAAETALQKLNTAIESISQGEAKVSDRQIQNLPVTSWETKQQSFLAYTWVDKNILLITPGNDAIAELIPQPRRHLGKDSNFIIATRSFPQLNHGYFYLNFGSSLAWAYHLVPPESNNSNMAIFKQVMGSIYSISATASSTAEGDRIDSAIVLAPAR